MTAPAPPHTRGGRLDLVQLFFNGAGRIRRQTFAVALLVVALTWRGWRGTPGRWLHLALDGPASLVLLAAACSVLSKRLHDLGLAGWWSAAPLALFALATGGRAPTALWQTASAVLALALVAALGAWPGQAGFNRFGPSPRERLAAA